MPFTVAIRMFLLAALLLPTTGDQNHTTSLADKMCHSAFLLAPYLLVRLLLQLITSICREQHGLRLRGRAYNKTPHTHTQIYI